MVLANFVMTSLLCLQMEEDVKVLNAQSCSTSLQMVHVYHAHHIVELKEMESNVDKMPVVIDRN